jgi:integrase
MAAYQAALAQEPLSQVGASRTVAGTINPAVVSYFASSAFKALAPTTQTTYRGILENFRAAHGDKRVGMLEHRHIDKIIAAKADTPSAANNLLKMLHALMQHAITQGLRRDDPTLGIKPIKNRSDGFHGWTQEEIAAFETRHPIGTRPRLAMALLLYTAQRRGDVIRMGRLHIRDGVLTIRQHKTDTIVEIPVHPELQAIIDAMPSDNITFLVTSFGKPFAPAGFGNLFRKWCREAGLPEACASHGLRKAAATRLADAQCSVHEIMSFTGHKTLKEVARYTEAAGRRRLAQSAAKKAKGGTAIVKPLNSKVSNLS